MRHLNLFLFLTFIVSLSKAATITVTNTNDAGAGSLRQAIASAGSGDIIQFSIGSGLQSIQLTTGDLVITQGITIDGTTQPGFSCVTPDPKIEIWGSSGNGLLINASSVIIRSLCINRCSQSGIYLGSDNVTIEGCYIGTNPGGTSDLGNSSNGIFIVNGADNLTIGGTVLCKRNIISGNNNHGIEIQGINTSISIINNYIGTDVSGLLDLGNTQHGIRAFNASLLTVGGTVASRNVIGGNDNQGMDIETCSNVIIRSNYIGIGSNGSTALGNGFTGITLRTNCATVEVGGSTTGQGNVIGSNGGMGIDAINSTGIIIKQNYIGVTANGLTARANLIHGVQIISCPATIIGGDRTTEGNIISNSVVHGINYDPGGDGGIIQGNLIGTDLNGTAAFGNGVINIVAKSNNMTIGGSTANLGNVIVDAKNTTVGDGLLLANANNAIVRKNLIGIGLDGVTALGNKGEGINISVEDAGQTASNNIIEYNTIAYNSSYGVSVGDALPVAALGAGGYAGCEAEDQNRIVRNSIFCNTLKGINLNKGGCDAGNIDKATPTINSGTATNFFLQGTASPNDSIHIYAQGNCATCTQGKTFVAGVKADGTGNWSYSTATPFGGQTSVTATDASNNTSEFATCVTLPVSWLYLRGEKTQNGNLISWATASEKNNAYFEIEKSEDGIHFSSIGSLPGRGTTSSVSHYQLLDESISNGVQYYKIRQVDIDGQASLSNTISVNRAGAFTVFVKNNEVAASFPLADMASIRVLDLQGREVYQQDVSGKTEVVFSIEMFASSLYVVEYVSGSERLTRKFLK